MTTLDTLYTVALGPLLLAQGRYTRRVTPKLPEPQGERTGICGSGPVLRLPERYDAVLVSVGVNDVTGGVSERDWCAGQSRLIALLRRKFEAERIILSRIPPMHRFPALPQPLRWYLGRRAGRLNRLLEREVPRHPGCVLLDLADAPLEQMMSEDGFHPGPSIYALWAEGAAALLLRQPGR
jgi:lysophospholipase L1-like esterase